MQKSHRWVTLQRLEKKRTPVVVMVLLTVIKSTMAGLEPTLPKEFDSTKQGIRVKRSNHFATLPTISGHHKNLI